MQLFHVRKKETPVEKESNTMLEEPKVTVEEQDVKVSVPSPESGLEFINASDCRTCHADDTKLIGPAYKDVAAKYENTEPNRKMLAEKNNKRRTRRLGRNSDGTTRRSYTGSGRSYGDVCS